MHKPVQVIEVFLWMRTLVGEARRALREVREAVGR